jgi:hypothetical protein
MDSIANQSSQGMGRSRGIRNCHIHSSPTINATLYDAALLLAVDGTNVTYANGTFTILKSSNVQESWNCIIGQPIYLTANTDTYSGNVVSDLGAGFVAALREDATYMYIDTTIQFATLPTWFEKVGILREGAIRFENCTGCDPVNLASEACRRGKSPREYYRYLFMGHFAQGGGWFTHKGLLKSLRLNVRQVSPAANTIMQFQCNVFDHATLAFNGALMFNFNCNIAGERYITETTATGLQSGDTITLNGVAQTYLPLGQIWNGQSQWYFGNLNPTTFPIYQCPIIDLEAEFDLGKIGVASFPRYNWPDVTGQVIIAGFTGQLP